MSHPNTFVRNLSKADAGLISGAFTAHSFALGEVVAEPGDPIGHVLFMHSGLLSVMVPLETGEAVETGCVGRDEIFGASGGLGAKLHVSKAIVQMPGVGSKIQTAELRKMANQSQTLRDALVSHEQFMLAQAQQTAACNARHTIPQRVATWLLRVSDRCHEDELSLTQEFLAQMMGVQRASVSIAAKALRDEGLIAYRRGRVVLQNRQALERLACECYAAIRSQRERTIGVVHGGHAHS